MPRAACAPTERWGNCQAPNQSAATYSSPGQRVEGEAQGFFPKGSQFSKHIIKRPDLLHAAAPAKYNLLCLKFSLILCMCCDFLEANTKKENIPGFMKIYEPNNISDPAKENLSPSDNT